MVLRRFRATVTSKGQVTIPVELRRAMGVREGDKLLFELEPDGTVQLRPTKYPTIESLAGAAGKLPAGRTLRDEEMGQIAADEAVDAYLRKVARSSS